MAVYIVHERFDRIAIDPKRNSGEPFLRSSGVSVATILNYLGSGKGVDDILKEWPELEREDVFQALGYAAWRNVDGPYPLGSE